jgi:GrpB-like predicted nucleotidyltransferase (UPF0157 family)
MEARICGSTIRRGVEYDDESWVRYLAFRDRLRRDPDARDDRARYTAGKHRLVSALLSG